MIDAIKRYKYSYLFLLILPFFIFMVAPNVILKMGVHSDYTIWTGDALAQMMPYVTYFRNHGFDLSAFTYNANYGVGNEMYGIFFYYLSSPVLWLIFLFPKNLLFNVVWVLIVLRYGLGGITFHTWLHKHYSNINSKVLLLLSLSYMLSGYFIFTFVFYQWLDFLFIIPLMMIGLDRIMNHKSIWLFTGSMIYMIISNFYIAYMLVMFSIFYIIYMMTVKKAWNKEAIFSVAKKYVTSGITSFIVTLPILYIIVLSMMNSRLSSSDVSSNSISWFEQNLSLVRFIGKFQLGSYSYQEAYDGHPLVWLSLGLLMIYILAYFHKDMRSLVKRTNAAMFVGLLLISSTHITYLLIHAGGLPNGLPYRHAFMFNMLILFMLAEFFDSVKPYRLFDYNNAYIVSKRWLMLIMFIFGLILCACFFLSHTAYSIFSVVSISIYFIYFIVLFVGPLLSYLDSLIILEYTFGSICVLVVYFLGFGYADSAYVSGIYSGIEQSNAPVNDNFRYSTNNRITSADNTLMAYDEYGSIALFASNKPNTSDSRLGVILGGDTVAYSGDGSQDYISDALLARKYIIDTNFDTSSMDQELIDTTYRPSELSSDMLTKEGNVYVNNYVFSRFYLSDSDYKVGTSIDDINLVGDQAKLFDSITAAKSLSKLDLPTVITVKKDGKVIDTTNDSRLNVDLSKGDYSIEVTITSDQDYELVYVDKIYDETDVYSDRVKYPLNGFAIGKSSKINDHILKKSKPMEFSLNKGENKMVFKIGMKESFDPNRLVDNIKLSFDLSQMYVFNKEDFKTSMSNYNSNFVVDTTIDYDDSGVYDVTVTKTDESKQYIDSSVIYDKNFTVSPGYTLINNEGFVRVVHDDNSVFAVDDTFTIGYELRGLDIVLIVWLVLVVVLGGLIIFESTYKK